jgi:thymidylate synthase
MKTYDSFTSAYVGLLKDVYSFPEYEAAPRGMKIRERLGYSFRIINIRDRIPYIPERDFSISYMIAELVWYMSGNNSTEWISNYSSFWKNISDDGVTANSAYGARIFKIHPYQAVGCSVEEGCTADKNLDTILNGWTQWQYLKDELKKDPDSRRAVIHIRMPQDSYNAQKDVPCTLALQFFIRDGALHQVASMRSSDLILGIAYDIPAFTMFQEMLAFELGVKCGTYTHISNSLHIYERHFPMVEKILKNPWVQKFPLRAQPMPSMPTAPPIEGLLKIDESCRKAESKEDLHEVWRSIPALLGTSESYWVDWGTILTAHRAGKLGLDDFQKELMIRVEFPGYTLFGK